MKLVPGPQEGLVHHFGGLVTMFVTADGQQPFVGQPDDHRPIARAAIGPPDDPADVWLIHRGEMVDEQGPDYGLLRLTQAVQHLVRMRGKGTVEAVDPAVLVRRQTQLPRRERPPHLVQGELEKRQRARLTADGLDEFVDERNGDLTSIQLSRAADSVAQFALF